MDSDKEYTIAEVSEHRSFDDCWMILGSEGKRMVYDITGMPDILLRRRYLPPQHDCSIMYSFHVLVGFLDDHPGGPEILMDLAGQIAHDEFEVST